MEVFYINLERRRDRRDRFLATNANMATFRRAEAADGKLLNVDELIRDGILNAPLNDYSPGALGCAMSHKRMWDLCVASSAAITLAEDDAVFNRHFGEKATAVMARLPKNWDIVLWGWNFDSILHVEIFPGLKDSVLHFDSSKLGPKLIDFQNQRYDVLPFRLWGAFGFVCYSISTQGARRLLERCFPLTTEPIPIPGLRRTVSNFGIDVAMNKHYRDLNAYVSFPPLVWTENDKTSSDISVTDTMRDSP